MKYTKGQQVRVVGFESDHGFKEGEEVVILSGYEETRVNKPGGFSYKCQSISNKAVWYVEEEDLTD